jgi:hypothetical protein
MTYVFSQAISKNVFYFLKIMDTNFSDVYLKTRLHVSAFSYYL